MNRAFYIKRNGLFVPDRCRINPGFLGSTVNRPPSGGGGGSGFTLIAHTGKSGTTGDTICSAINPLTANLFVTAVSYSSGSTPTLIDAGSNTWAGGQQGSFGGGKTALFWVINPNIVTSHTVTVQTVGGCNLVFMAFSKAGGTPVFDSASAGGNTADWLSTTIHSGSITPATANNLFVAMVTFDIGSGAGDTVDSGYTMIDSPLSNGGVVKQDTAYLCASSDSSAKNPGWLSGPHADADAWTIQGSWK